MEIAGQDAELPEIRRRARYFALVVVAGFLGIVGRLFYLQIIEGDSFYRVTSDSIVKTEVLPAIRGQVRDRKGKVVATMRPAYTGSGTARQINAATFARLRSVLGMTGDDASDAWERIQATQQKGKDGAAAKAPERPVLVAEDVSREAM